MSDQSPVITRHRQTVRAFATTVVPGMMSLDEAGWQQVEATMERALALRPPRMHRQLSILLRVIERLPLLRYGRRFSALDPAQRTRMLDALQHAPAVLLRRGVWGLRTLVLMGYYTRADTMREIGYRAHAGGWRTRAARQGAAQETRP